MKRIILLLILTLVLFISQGLLNCSSPLESDGNGSIPNPPIILDSTDTIFITDTIFNNDTIIITDTLFISDSTITVDTITIIDTNIIIDTVINTDTLIVTDTVTVYDSSTVFDTITVIDTVVNWDTIFITDTTTTIDTIIIVDTLPGDTIYDTTIITVPDSTGGIPFCARMSSHLPEIVWLVNAEPGEYNFDFLALADEFKKNRELILTINDTEYRWEPAVNDELIIDQMIEGRITIKIVPDNPAALGHEVDVCVTITHTMWFAPSDRVWKYWKYYEYDLLLR